MVYVTRGNDCRMLPLSTLLKRGYTPTLKDFNNFLLFLSRNQRFKAVINLFSQLKSNKIVSDSQTHKVFTKALLKEHKYEQAADFLKTLVGKPDILYKNRVFDSVVQGLCTFNKDPEKGFSLMRDLCGIGGFFPSSNTFCVLICYLSKMGKMDGVIELLSLMSDDKFKYPFNNYVCSSVISGFVRIGESELAVGFYETALKSDSLKPNTVTCTAVVNAYCKLRNFGEVSELVAWMENNALAFDVVFYSNWMNGVLRGGLIREAFQRFREMVDRKVELDNISYTILIDGFSKDGNVEKAVGFLYKMRRDGIEPNLVTYTAIIMGFCKKGKLDEAFQIFSMLKKLGIEADEFTYAILIDGVCRRGDFDMVFQLLDEMPKRGISPGIVTYNTVINGLCRVGRTSEADDLSKGIGGVSKGIGGDVITYTTLLQGYVKEQNKSGILETISRLEAAGVHMDVIMCNVLIKALLMVGLFEDAFAVFKELPQMGFSANSVTYYTLIDGYCKAGRMDEALEIFDEFRKTSSDSSSACYNCIITHLCEKGMVEMGIHVFLEYIKKCLPLEKTTYLTMIEETLNRRGEKQLAQLILASFVKSYGMSDLGVCEIIINYLCLHDVGKALLFISTMNERKQSITIPITVFKKLIQDGGVFDAYELLMRAENNLPDINVVHYSVLIDAFCKQMHIDKALDICTLAKKKGVALNIVTYNSVINGLCIQGCLVEAFRLFDSLEKIGILPTEITYGTLIDALVKEGLLKDARMLFERMIFKNLCPNIHIYNALINGYCKSNLLDEAIKLFQDLEVRSLEPDGFTVGSLINGYCQKGDMEGALKLFFEFERKGLLPDFMGFMYLVRGLCAKGRMEESRSILREMVRAPSVVNLLRKVDTEVESDSVESLLVYLCERGNIHEAVALLGEVESVLSSVGRNSSTHTWGPQELEDGREQEKLKDFDSFYSVIRSLCSNGEQSKANRITKLFMEF